MTGFEGILVCLQRLEMGLYKSFDDAIIKCIIVV